MPTTITTRLLAVTLVFSTLGCASYFSPALLDSRIVTPISRDSRVLSIKEPMVWYDTNPPKVGILFPAGDYPLVAEDSEYLFYSAPKDIEMRTFSNGNLTEKRASPGGMFIAKSSFSTEPAGAYVDEGGNSFLRIWRLGREFLDMRGSKWELSE